jgi:hypothetical protein
MLRVGLGNVVKLYIRWIPSKLTKHLGVVVDVPVIEAETEFLAGTSQGAFAFLQQRNAIHVRGFHVCVQRAKRLLIELLGHTIVEAFE